MRASLRILAILLGCVLVSAVAAFASPLGSGREQPAGHARLADVPRGGLWCRLQRPTHQARQWWWIGSSDTARPKWIVQPRWPQLFPDGRQSLLSFDPILRRHWWD